jgi:hypothetical protein
MTKRDRGILRPDHRTSTVGGNGAQSAKTSISATRQPYLATNSLKWDPNNFMPTLLNSEKPLLDNSNTPRGAKRAITLERSFDSFPFMYSRNTMEGFNNAFQIAKDKNKSKILKKQIR